MTPDAAAATPAELRFRLIALWVLAALMAVTAVHQVSIVLAAQPLGIDFLPMWTGARAWLDGHREVYDFVAITDRQAWALEAHHGLRPFVYPPSGLLLFLPFATLPFWWAYGLWTGATGLLFAGVTASVVPRHRLLTGVLALVLSPCAMVVLIGQSTFLVGAMAALAVIWLKDRPLAAGVLLGLAAAIKPQTLVLAPLVLAAGGHWRALAAATAAGAAAGLLSMLVFGLDLWRAWLAALPAFADLVRDNAGLMSGSITPAGLGAQLNLDGAALLAWRGAFAAAAVVLAFLTFRRTAAPALRLAALLGGGLLVAPYATFYDAGLLVPAAVWLAVGEIARPGWPLWLCGLLMLVVATIPWLGGLAVLGFLLVTLGPLLLNDRRFSIS